MTRSVKTCQSLDEVRLEIDQIDHQLVTLLAQRGKYVQQAAAFKKTTDDVRAPARVEAVIERVKAKATETGANPAVVEAVYRAMIDAFINAELDEHAALQKRS